MPHLYISGAASTAGALLSPPRASSRAVAGPYAAAAAPSMESKVCFARLPLRCSAL